MDQNKMMLIQDDQGNEVEVEILFTFESEDYNKQYVVFCDPAQDDETVYVYSYDDEGNIEAVEDEKEWEMIDEVIGSYNDEEF